MTRVQAESLHIGAVWHKVVLCFSAVTREPNDFRNWGPILKHHVPVGDDVRCGQGLDVVLGTVLPNAASAFSLSRDIPHGSMAEKEADGQTKVHC